jgi:hypothetical protein
MRRGIQFSRSLATKQLTLFRVAAFKESDTTKQNILVTF